MSDRDERRANRRALPSVLRQRSLVEGVFNGRRGWLAVAAATWGFYGLRKALRRDEAVLLREVLQPGERLIVQQLITRPTRRQKRRASRST